LLKIVRSTKEVSSAKFSRRAKKNRKIPIALLSLSLLLLPSQSLLHKSVNGPVSESGRDEDGKSRPRRWTDEEYFRSD
jgi:hypothetical protein